ncbi:hypothetical protein ONZ45_g978 [Pleurotus djamor]|nr:hypothetical protein ONZ45_g978 [Pleurotus djamor]
MSGSSRPSSVQIPPLPHSQPQPSQPPQSQLQPGRSPQPRKSPAIQGGAEAILALIEEERSSVIKSCEEQLDLLRSSNHRLQLENEQLRAQSSPQSVYNAELAAKILTLQNQFSQQQISASQELSAAVAAAKADSAEMLKSMTKRLGEKEAYITSLIQELAHIGLYREGNGPLRFTGEWKSFVQDLVLLQTPAGQPPIPPEQFPLEPLSLLAFLQHTHKAYVNTVRLLQEKCFTVERQRDQLRAAASNPVQATQPTQPTDPSTESTTVMENPSLQSPH